MKHEADYLLEHNMIPKEELVRVFNESETANGEMDYTFLCFGDEYKNLSEILLKDTVILDLGCAYNPQSYYFKDFDRTISVDLSFGNNVRFQPKNNEIYIDSIQHFIKETLPTLNLDLEKCFAICSYVPDEEAQKMVAETFPYHSIIYCDKVISKQLPEYINEMDLTTQKLLESFPGSCLLTDREPIEFLADRDSNTYFILGDCITKEDIDCKVLEWLSRAACKTQPYDSNYKNKRLHQKILDGISRYFGRAFTQDGMMQIYTYLGNAVNHEKTLLFIRNGFDMDILPIKSTMIESNMGKIPLEDYLDIKAQQCGFEDYKDLRAQGFHLNFNNENKTEEIEDIEKE